VDLGAGFGDVGCVAVELEPEVFDLRVAESFEDVAVEFVAGGVGGTGEVSGFEGRGEGERAEGGRGLTRDR
jgi:hypothetical protein